MSRWNHALGSLLCLVLTSSAAGAVAGVPDPLNSSVEPILVGGSSGNLLPGLGAPGFQVIVRDINNNPIVGVNVVLEFHPAGAAIRLQTSQNSGTTVACGQGDALLKATNTMGEATFGPRFGGFVNESVVVVSAEGILLGLVPARSTDINALGGTTDLADLNLFRAQFFATQPAAPQTDYTGDGNTGLSDLNTFRLEFFSLATGAYCL